MATTVRDKIDDPYGIVDLRALVAHPNKHVGQIIHGILVSHGADLVDEIEDEPTLRNRIVEKGYDVVFVDESFSSVGLCDFVRNFRRVAAVGNRKIPVIALMTEPTAKDVTLARDAGVNEIVIKPFSSLALSRHLARAVRPRAFIESKTYVGPDRRWRDLPPPLGIDRREGAG